jgi:hypothetical protein
VTHHQPGREVGEGGNPRARGTRPRGTAPGPPGNRRPIPTKTRRFGGTRRREPDAAARRTSVLHHDRKARVERPLRRSNGNDGPEELAPEGGRDDLLRQVGEAGPGWTPPAASPGSIAGPRRSAQAGRWTGETPPRWIRPPRPRTEAPSSRWLHAGRERARNLAACDVHAERALIPRTTPETAPTDSEERRMMERGPDPRGGHFGGFARGTAPVVP